jgi:hypothetical protein
VPSAARPRAIRTATAIQAEPFLRVLGDDEHLSKFGLDARDGLGQPARSAGRGDRDLEAPIEAAKGRVVRGVGHCVDERLR